MRVASVLAFLERVDAHPSVAREDYVDAAILMLHGERADLGGSYERARTEQLLEGDRAPDSNLECLLANVGAALGFAGMPGVSK
jgi:hypothetical protein